MNNTSITPSELEVENLVFERFQILGKASLIQNNTNICFSIITANNRLYHFKMTSTLVGLETLKLRQHLVEHLKSQLKKYTFPTYITDIHGQTLSQYKTANGDDFYICLQRITPGRSWNRIHPKLDDLKFDLGQFYGTLTKIVSQYHASKTIEPNPENLEYPNIKKQISHTFSKKDQEVLNHFIFAFEAHTETFQTLRSTNILKLDLGNHILVSQDTIQPKVIGISDVDHLYHNKLINGLAQVCAAVMTRQNTPLQAVVHVVKGFHKSFPLREEELEHLYFAIGVCLITTAVKTKDNTILSLLKTWKTISSDFALYCFRAACGLQAHPNETAFYTWLKSQNFSLSALFPSIQKNKIVHLDLSVSSPWIGSEAEFNNLDIFQNKITALQKEHPNKIIAGGYLEPRALYTDSAYDTIGHAGKTSRTIHLGVDYWLPESTPVHALLNGEVVAALNAKGHKNYGGLIILKHQFNSSHFYTLYGHLSLKSTLKHKPGDRIKKGDYLAELGNPTENGNWVPHLHFQIMLSLLNFKNDFPGVTFCDEVAIWKSICPNPNLFFSIELYPNPLVSNPKWVRSTGVYLLNELGIKYLNLAAKLKDTHSKSNSHLKTNKPNPITHPVIEELSMELHLLASKYAILNRIETSHNDITFSMSDSNAKPLFEHSSYVKTRMKAHKILISQVDSEPNIIKLNIPIGFNREHGKDLIFYLDKILSEDFMTSY